ncbi:uncharacterized protein LOC127900709 [Citrus sinensis]|uniref:uncharacterized protein LOC127900709 n=1 Tax=Citrus sinensis TaxID=2711 RepID=UPI002277C8D1|nr:uncharacterized protein LOC127900709 [Citrus sinensis]
MVADFRESVKDCKLEDVGCRGHRFTWSNRRFGPHYIEEILDRFMCNQKWRAEFYDWLATNLIHWESDHCPIMMVVQNRQRMLNYEKTSFNRIHYEDMWSSYDGCKNIMKREWLNWGDGSKDNPVQMFTKVSKSSMAHLKFWSKEAFGSREKKLKSLMKKLERAKQGNLQNDDRDDVRSIERHIQNLLIDEEVYWKQRFRADWLKVGDKNTKFFNHKASARKRKN